MCVQCLLRVRMCSDPGDLTDVHVATLTDRRRQETVSPTEATADAIEQLSQTSETAQRRTDLAFNTLAAHPGPSGECNSHISALVLSPGGLLFANAIGTNVNGQKARRCFH